MLPYTVLLLFIFFDRVNSQVGVTFPSTDAVAGEDAKLECAFNLETRTYRASFLIQSDVDGSQGDTLVGSSSTSAPGSKYRAEEDLTNNRVFFVITNTTKSDEGYYLCLIENSGFDVDSNVPAKLTVQYIEKPVLSSFPTPVTKGDMVNMSCSADAVPSAMYTFLMDGEVQQPEGSSTFLIQPASRDNDGSYQCSARNNAGTKTSESRTLVVHFKPEVALDKEEFTVAPGKDNTITATVVANPVDITYKWTIDPEIVVTETSSSTFTFKVPESVENGTVYTVTVNVTNSIGSTTESAQVTVTNPCNPNPCKNGGTCSKDGAAGYKCDCPIGYTGMNCEDVLVIVVIVVFSVGGCGTVGGGCFCCCVKVKATVKKSNTGEPSITVTVEEVAVKGGTSDGVEVVAGAASVTVTKENDLVRYEAKSGAVNMQTYMDYVPAGNENRTYQELQHREETAYVNVKPRKK